MSVLRNRRRVCLGLLVAVGLPLGWPPPDSLGQSRAFQQLAELSGAFESLAEQVNPAVVQVLVTGYVPPGAARDDDELLIRQHVSGSGVILDPDGYIVTNAHVVEGATRIRVRLALQAADAPPGRSILSTPTRTVGAQIVGVDRETDLAVLKVSERNLPFLPLGDSEELKRGQVVLAFGSPLGLDGSVSVGVISAPVRQLEPDSPMIYVQTDAPINPGSSGGPLVDTSGRLVGINTFVFSRSGGNEGLGFAAPSNIVRYVFDQMRTTGRVLRGEIGVRPQTITPRLASGLGLARTWGVVLSDVFPGSPAARAGLAAGDLVLTLDGKMMENGRQFQVNLYRRGPGERVRLELDRQGRRLDVTVPIVERPNDPVRLATLVTPANNLVRPLGILAMDLTDEIARMFPAIRASRGVVVAASSREAPEFDGEPLLPGDIIHSANGQPVADLASLRSVLASQGRDRALVLHVERQGQLRFIVLEPA